ncbi:uncharacterized protein LOC141617264 [Silene latifolia]|uniref:uncharacterized protein LOC141617264 n=1 Tax=Silene latifolia TaxID=37657 RepID=UPI003D76EA29
MDHIRNEFQNTFMDLYLSSNVNVEWRDRSVFEDLLQPLDHSFSQDEMDRLSRPFTAKEVRTAVFQMGALKAPGPDGIPAVFFQRCWSMVKGDVTKAILSILNSGRVLRELNRTFITLIPKKDSPEGVSDYRPISLCNVTMRIVTKCIANRLARVMGSLVSETQNAFLPGRSISDNILVAHEAINKITIHRYGRQALCAFKADMSKAYDRVRWDFLEAVLVRYGFPQSLITLMMNCFTSVSYEILMNGIPLPQFKPQCGLRQGDPLSPYLFIICMEVLSRNIAQANELRLIHGIQLVREVRPITHLLFADDSIFFFKDKEDTVAHLVHIINDYCNASGQKINVEKSGILFSQNTTLIKAQKIMKAFNIKKNNGIGKYLGIPADLKSLRKGFLLPLLIMSPDVFLHGMGFFYHRRRRLTRFHRFYPISQTTFYRSSKFRIFRQKIFGTATFHHGIHPIRGTGCSWGVRSILHGLSFVLENIGWKPGIASKINVWTERLVGGERPEPRNEWLGLNTSHLANLQVRDLLLSDGNWNEGIIKSLFTEEWTMRILAIPRCEVRLRDKIYWPHTTSGVFTVKSAYGIIFEDYMIRVGTVKDKSRLNDRSRLFCRTILWKLPIPQMWKLLIWKIITNVLPIGHEFYKRSIDVDPSCGMCGRGQQALKTPEHLFRDCGFSSRIWAGSDLGIRVEGAEGVSISDWICNWIRYLAKKEEGIYQVISFVATLWALWTTRNRIRFQDQDVNSHIITNMIYRAIRERVNILRKSLDKKKWAKVDASWNRNFEAAFGWIAYDDMGSELGRRQVRTRAESALQAEAKGVRDIVLWAQEWRHLHLDVSSDCLQLINQLAGADKDDHRITGILEDIRSSFNFFHCLCFNFIPRRLNGIAHNLAKQAMKL